MNTKDTRKMILNFKYIAEPSTLMGRDVVELSVYSGTQIAEASERSTKLVYMCRRPADIIILSKLADS
jgi:hypothetical protein